MLGTIGRMSTNRLRTGTATNGEIEQAIKANRDARSLPFWIFDHSLTSLDGISAKSRQVQALAKKPIGLIVVDYLQLMSGTKSRESREQFISRMSRGLKCLARDLSVPILALSQLNRGVEQRENKRPLLSDLRESGAIEQDADQVWFVYREGYYREEADQKRTEVIVAKNRRGRCATASLAFEGDQSRFTDWSEGVRWTA